MCVYVGGVSSCQKHAFSIARPLSASLHGEGGVKTYLALQIPVFLKQGFIGANMNEGVLLCRKCQTSLFLPSFCSSEDQKKPATDAQGNQGKQTHVMCLSEILFYACASGLCAYLKQSWCVCVCVVVSAYARTTLQWRTVCLMACFCSLAPALPSRRPPAQTRAKPPSGRAARGSAKPVCKTEPGVENPAGEQPVDSGQQWFSVWAYNSHIKPCRRRSAEASCSLLFCVV